MREGFESVFDRLTIVAWPDPALDVSGHDPRGQYVEKYWLGVLGPSTTWLLRHLTNELEASPSGFIMNLDETARRIGIHSGGKNSPFRKSLGRLVKFELAVMQSSNVLAVRRRVPSLARRHVARLSDHLRAQHDHWQRQRLQPI